jgi:hypothetical protein
LIQDVSGGWQNGTLSGPVLSVGHVQLARENRERLSKNNRHGLSDGGSILSIFHHLSMDHPRFGLERGFHPCVLGAMPLGLTFTPFCAIMRGSFFEKEL